MLPPGVAMPSDRMGTVVVTLVTGETVTWAGAAPAGRQLRSPGTKWRRAGPMPLLASSRVRDDMEGVDEAAVGGVDAAVRLVTALGTPGMGERIPIGGDSEPGDVMMDSCDPATPRFVLVAADDGPAPPGPALPPPPAAAAAAWAAWACLRTTSAMACASVCCGTLCVLSSDPAVMGVLSFDNIDSAEADVVADIGSFG
jgi:hypothetical protein